MLADVWFLLVFVLFAIYAILDGFDLGVGFWYIFAKDSQDKSERRLLMSAIAPFWDGNEVWLLLAGGVIFIAFPDAYATLFSGGYLAVILLIVCLIFRAVSIELRDEIDNSKWRKGWDLGFIVGSVVPMLLFGVVAGNVLRGMPLNSDLNYTGTFFDLLNPFSLLVGLLAVAMFINHAAIFITYRCRGVFVEKQIFDWTKYSLIGYIILYLVPFVYDFVLEPEVLGQYSNNALLLIIPIIGLLTIGATYYFWDKKQEMYAFIASAVSIFVSFLTVAFAIYPNLIRDISATDGTNSIVVSTAASSDTALTIYLVVALIGLPIALAYFIFVYRLHRGKIGLEDLVGY
jgi:cytochrome d ubiquinol oxidase subunit II